MREVSARIKELETELAAVEADRAGLAGTIPNPPDPEAPDGDTDEDAVVLREVGERPAFGFEVRDHLDLGRALGLIETEKAAAASGSRFAYLLGDLVLVELALIRFAVGLVGERGFTPVVPPVLVREEPLYGTGFFPGEREMIYEVERDELFLVGTSEVALAALHADEILDGADLPIRYAGISTCFRREAGAAGKDTRGIFRVHQFDKVEMFSFVEPSTAKDEHERLLAHRGADPRRARDPLPGRRHPGRRPRSPRRPQVRLRGLDPEPAALPRADLDLEHDRLPGAPPRLPLPIRRGRGPRARPHPQRHRGRRRPHPDRDHREPPGRGRLDLDPPGPDRQRRPRQARLAPRGPGGRGTASALAELALSVGGTSTARPRGSPPSVLRGYSRSATRAMTARSDHVDRAWSSATRPCVDMAAQIEEEGGDAAIWPRAAR